MSALGTSPVLPSSFPPDLPHLSQQDDPLHVGGVQDGCVLQQAPERLFHQRPQLPYQLAPLGLAAHPPAEVQPAAEARGPVVTLAGGEGPGQGLKQVAQEPPQR